MDKKTELEEKTSLEVTIEPEQTTQAFVIPATPPQSITLTQSSIQTPYLPPEFLERYESLLPGTAQKIFEMAQTQQQFAMEIKRHDMKIDSENFARVVRIDDANLLEMNEAAIARTAELKIKARGQLFALVVFLVSMLTAIVFGCLKMQAAAICSLGITLGAMAILFLQKHPESEQKKEQDKPEIKDTQD